MYLKIAKQLSAQYMSDPEYNATEDLVKIAQENQLNAHEIERICNRANREIIVGLQKEAILGNQDPHFSFPTIKTAEVIAMIRPSTPRAQARRPVTKKASYERQQIAGPKYDLADYELEDIGSDKGLASQVMDVWKLAEANKRSAFAQIDYAIEAMVREFDKQAAQELLSGTPVEAIEALGIESPVIERLESWGHKLAHLDDEIELMPNHPLVKLATQILEKRIQLDIAAEELVTQETKTASLRAHIKRIK